MQGGLFVILNGSPTIEKLGHMMSFSAGVMLFISFMDLLPDAVSAIGFFPANCYVRSSLPSRSRLTTN
jgi:zinc transporter, ZIP family